MFVFTGLHFVSWKPFWLQDLHLRFILGVYLKKNRNNIIQQAFTFPTCALVFPVGDCHVSFHDQFSDFISNFHFALS